MGPDCPIFKVVRANQIGHILSHADNQQLKWQTIAKQRQCLTHLVHPLGWTNKAEASDNQVVLTYVPAEDATARSGAATAQDNAPAAVERP